MAPPVSPNSENSLQMGGGLSEVTDLPMSRVHPASLAPNAASISFARNLESPGDVDPRTKFHTVYLKKLKGFYRGFAKGALGGEDTSTSSAFTRLRVRGR